MGTVLKTDTYGGGLKTSITEKIHIAVSKCNLFVHPVCLMYFAVHINGSVSHQHHV